MIQKTRPLEGPSTYQIGHLEHCVRMRMHYKEAAGKRSSTRRSARRSINLVPRGPFGHALTMR